MASQKHCSFFNCFKKSTKKEFYQMFTFPKEENRCMEWMQRTCNLDILELRPSQVVQQRRAVCKDHFNDDQFFNEKQNKLKRNMVPNWNVHHNTSDDKCHPVVLCHQLPSFAVQQVDSSIIDKPIGDTTEGNNPCPAANILSEERSSHSKKPQRKCSAKGCTDIGQKLFSLPNVTNPLKKDKGTDEERLQRCKQWLLNSGNPELLESDLGKLRGKFFLCSNHFETKHFHNEHRQTLLYTAVPTIFSSVAGNIVGTEQEEASQPSTSEAERNQDLPSRSILQPDRTIRSNRQQRKCSSKGCKDPGQKLFSFPNFSNPGKRDTTTQEQRLLRCKLWLSNSGNDQLLDVDPSTLHGKFFLCSNHFETDQFHNQNRQTLLPTAVPTIFIDPPDVTAEAGTSFDSVMNSLQWRKCNQCKEKFFTKADSKKMCLHGKNACPLFTDMNDMDPKTVPPELQDLSYVEEMLIARVHPLISVYKIKGHQFGYKGHVINFPQDVKSFAKQLPHRISDVSSMIVIRTSNAENPTDHTDFYVSASKVRRALLWLKENNPYYYDIEINEENLCCLPENGNVFEDIPSIQAEEDEDEDDDSEDSSDDGSEETDSHRVLQDIEIGDVDIEGSTIYESCAPTMGKPSEEDQINNVINWPTINKECIDEFRTPGYVVQAFPCLFPYGKADLRSPRQTDITPAKYFQHLMRYEDGRFAKHSRFRYWAFNSIMRWNALRDGGIFVKKNAGLAALTVEQLKAELEQNPNLIKKIMFNGSNLKGTRAFWYARGMELSAMIEQLDLPTMYITLSAADFHWQDQFRLLCPGEDPNSISEKRRRELIQENPDIVDEFFLVRCETFIEEVLKKLFDIVDIWFRIEFQHRGTPHLHGLIWFRNAPDLSNIQNATDQEKADIIAYFDKLVSTMHPDINTPPAPVHPSRTLFSEIENLEQDLAELLNRVQRHLRCTIEYCLRKRKRTGERECRFGFPMELREETEIVQNDEQDVEILTARNDPYLNKYNRSITQIWRANTDVAPVISKKKLTRYLAKYLSKAELQSMNLSDLLKLLYKRTDCTKSAKYLIQRLYIHSCAERDYGGQEVHHILMNRKLYSTGGRRFVHINLRKNSDEWLPICSQGDNPKASTFVQKYQSRPKDFEGVSLREMALKYQLPTCKKNTREPILQIFPRYTTKQQNQEDYYRQLVLLDVPWRREEDLLDNFQSWKEVYLHHQEIICETPCTLGEIVQEEDDYEMENEENDTLCPEEWMTISRMGANQAAEKVELGRREIDRNNEWHRVSQEYDQYGGIPALRSFLSEQRQTFVAELTPVPMPSVDFTREQTAILNLVRAQIHSLKDADLEITVPQSVIVQGKAGTGKSLVIHGITNILHTELGAGSYLLMGPTGVSAVNIGGSTLHSKLHINMKGKEFTPLKGPAAHEFKQSMKDVKFVIIDEYSMVGCKMISMIEQRLQEAKGVDKEYGGVFLYLFGDSNQLAPVGDSPPYSQNQQSPDHIRGKVVYSNIQASAVLTVVKRQANAEFRALLENVSNGTLTSTDYSLLQSRFQESLSKRESDRFKDAIRLFPRRQQVDNFNKETLENLRNEETKLPVPVARVPGKHNSLAAAIAPANDAEGLEPVLYLAEGAKIMLRSNLWTEKGLVNGSLGKVIHILYENDASPPDDIPSILICSFENYSGPYLDTETKTIPIMPLTKTWMNASGELCSRTNFPVSLSYACSIHKSQGLTLEKVYLDIGDKEMSPGLTYTGLSRATKLSGLVLKSFHHKRLFCLNGKQYIQRRQDWIQKLTEHQILKN